MKRVAIVGASGIVGKELIRLLEKRNFPLKSLHLFGSEKSRGKKISFRKQSLLIEVPTKERFQNIDLFFFAISSTLSKKYFPWIENAKIIDLSSAFRDEKSIPLIIPEINRALLKNSPLIASPNCVASIAALALHPLHRAFLIKRVIITAFQSASGGGKDLLKKLEKDTKEALEKETDDPYHYGFNIFPHTSHLNDNGYVEEEMKIARELKKILHAPKMHISATSIRVPVKRAHSLSLNIEFAAPFSLSKAESILLNAPGLKRFETKGTFPTPNIASYQEEVFYGRLRRDISHENALEMWIVGDQLLKGAALNALQIAEEL